MEPSRNAYTTTRPRASYPDRMPDRPDEQLARIAEALGVSPDVLLRAALAERFAEQADAEAARAFAERLERPDEWDDELDEPDLWSETVAEQREPDDEID